MIFWKVELTREGSYVDDYDIHDGSELPDNEEGVEYFRTKKEAGARMKVLQEDYFEPLMEWPADGEIFLHRCHLPCRYANSTDLVAALNENYTSHGITRWSYRYEQKDEDEYKRKIFKDSLVPRSVTAGQGVKQGGESDPGPGGEAGAPAVPVETGRGVDHLEPDEPAND